MYAAEKGHAEVARTLLEAGVDIHHVDNVSNLVYIEYLLTYIVDHIVYSRQLASVDFVCVDMSSS